MTQPLYRQIYQSLLLEIQQSRYQIGQRFPSEKEILETYAVSRITAIRALKELEDAGYIERHRGKGNILVATNPTATVSSGKSVSPKNNIIGLVIPFLSYPQVQPEHFRYVQGVTDYLLEKGYRTVLYTRNDTFNERDLLLRAKTDGCDGIICYPEKMHYIFDLLHRIAVDGYPMVLLDHGSSGLPLPVVGPDNYMGQYNLINKLTEQGHKKILYYSFDGFDSSHAILQRYLGYDTALRDKGIIPEENWVCILKSADYLGTEKVDHATPEQLEQLQWELLSPRLEEGFTAICTSDDYQAVEIATLLQKRGIDLNHIAVCGFDGLSFLQQYDFPIISTKQDFYQIGYQAAKELIQILETKKKSKKDILVPNLC